MLRRKKKKSLSNQIKKLRIDLGMTQGELAEFLGMGKNCTSVVNRWERGVNSPPGYLADYLSLVVSNKVKIWACGIIVQ